MHPSRFAVRRPVAVSMAFLAVVVLGIISFTRLPIDLLPDVSYPRLVVYTSMPETAPEEIERLVSTPIERQVATVPGVQRVTSISRDGVSLVTLRFGWGTNMDFAMVAVREKLDGVRGSLPETASRPQMLRVDPESEPVMVVSVAGEVLWDTKELAENVFRRRLEQLDGVAQAIVAGGLDREIQVIVDPARLESYGISIQDVADAIAQANRSGAGGQILQGAIRYPLRTVGEFRTVEQIEDVVVRRRDLPNDAQRTLPVAEIARVVDGFADREAIARYNGREAVGLLVFKEAGANTVNVARAVDEVLEVLGAEFPAVQVDVAYSQAGFIRDSIDNVVSALILGGMLAFLVLFLFLREPRYPIAVALAIPISLVGTFALMDALGVSLNIMSLGGLALGVGMLVDNSIIVLENIFRHRGEGMEPAEGAAAGAEEVSGAITASTLTTIAVFVPIIYVEGVAGELFRDLSLAVAISLSMSLGVALTLLPSLAARLRLGRSVADAGPGRLAPERRPAGVAAVWWLLRVMWRLPIWLLRLATAVARELVTFWWSVARRAASATFGRPLRAFDRVFEAFAGRYHRALVWSLENRGRVLAVAGLALVATVWASLSLDRDLLPRVDQGAFEVGLELQEGTALQRTARVAQALEAILLADPGVEAVFGTVGRDVRRFAQSDDATDLHTAHFQVRLREGAATAPVVERLRPLLASAAPEGVVTVLTGQATALGQVLGGSDADVAVRIRGEELGEMFAYADAVAQRLGSLAGITNVRVGSERGQPQFAVEVLHPAANLYGVTPAAVATAVEHSIRGTRATDFIAFDRRVPVMVRIPDELRYDIATLERLQVGGVPLRELVAVHLVDGPAEIRREDQSRVVPVLADLSGRGLDQAIAQVESVLAEIPVPRGLRVEIGGENEEMRRSFRDLAMAFALALFLVYMILAAQFESFLHPATILAAVPLALIGAVLALLLSGQGLNTMSLIGLVILVGIVVNDSIVKVSFIARARQDGAELRDAILEAGRVRLRPILMTTATTVLGLTPMALGIGRGADLRAPLAIAVIGGLIVATLLTLIIVPVLFSVVEEARLSVAPRSSSDAPSAGTDDVSAAPASILEPALAASEAER
jgi:hydrophobic/amphiphilic exporter-1 (mainly G- bacteria), HAE1 family